MTARDIHHKVAAGAMLLLVSAAALSLRASGPDQNLGKELFSKRCSGCHALDVDKGGPRLRGILNRKAGAVNGFLYSDALRNAAITWDEKRLDQWLENPESVVKGNDMEFRVPNPEERTAIIAYLKSLAK